VFLHSLLDGMCGYSWELLMLRPKHLFRLGSVILAKSHNTRKQDLLDASSILLLERESTVLGNQRYLTDVITDDTPGCRRTFHSAA
jgi:hypothetical protein